MSTFENFLHRVDTNKSTNNFIEINSKTSDNKAYRNLDNCPDLHTTPFATKIELTADYQGSCILFASNELYGSAKNLIKTTVNNDKQDSRENEEGKLILGL